MAGRRPSAATTRASSMGSSRPRAVPYLYPGVRLFMRDMYLVHFFSLFFYLRMCLCTCGRTYSYADGPIDVRVCLVVGGCAYYEPGVTIFFIFLLIRRCTYCKRVRRHGVRHVPTDMCATTAVQHVCTHVHGHVSRHLCVGMWVDKCAGMCDELCRGVYRGICL